MKQQSIFRLGDEELFASRRRFMGMVPGVAAFAMGADLAQAQAPSGDIPTAPVKLLVGFAPGTSPDVAARILALQVEKTWKAGVIVENRPGAGGGIAAAAVGAAAPDGLTLLWGSTAEIAIAPALSPKLSFDPSRLRPIMDLMTSEMLFVTGAQVPVKTMAEFAQWSQAKSPLLIGTFGPGSAHHLLSLLLGRALGRPVEPVHYRATNDVVRDLSANDQLHGAFATAILVRTWAAAGKAKVLGVVTDRGSTIFPDAPTFRALGLSQVELPSWTGLFGPPGISDALMARAYGAFSAGLRAPELRGRAAELGYIIFDNPYGSFEQRVRNDRLKLVQIVNDFNLKVE
jgi:tripartite-type tricarboxylate transporter receptor subunit TctC